ncbi:hypothetical protein, partial [Salmonella sp. s57610]|uniref:hypothetical protein n=1 Tax=Salmonella sp. s57610 TaxID=3159697 RepID=UPI00398066C9
HILHYTFYNKYFQREEKQREVAKKMSAAATANVWMGELTKLKEKVRARKPFLFRLKRREDDDQEVHENEAKQTINEQREKETTISEATICLLMDRFAPY